MVKLSRIILGMWVLVALGCTFHSTPSGKRTLENPALEVKVTEGFKPLRVNSVALLPLQTLRVPHVSGALGSALTGKLANAFQVHSSLELVLLSDETSSAFAKQELTADREEPSCVKRARIISPALDVQGILCAELYRYRDATGSGMGTEDFAAVGFRLWLLDRGSGRTLWSAAFDKASEPVAKNLLQVRERLSEGLRFQSADQLINEGFLEAALEFEKLRNSTP